jgi:O-antigen/teichoic acid export membrane protein
MFIARLLTPGEIGTFAIASAIVVVMSEFRMLGAGMYLVREHDIPKEKIQSALGLTMIISWSLGALIFLSAPLVATFYKLPEVTNIFRILSLSFFLAPYISIPTALLTRRFKFDTLFYIKVVATLVGFASTLSFVYMGYSFYGLALGHALTIVVEFIIIICFFWPSDMSWRPRFGGLKPIVSVGIFSSLANLLNRATLTLPDMIIGKMGTIVQVGIFSRGLGLIDFLSQLLMTGIGPVALPHLSETKRSGGDVRWAYTKASVLIGGMVWPVLAVASVASLPVIRLFFGGQWDEAAHLAAWLAFWGMIRSTHCLSNNVLLVSGEERIMVIKELVVFVVFFAAIIVAYPYGLGAIAVAFVLAGVWDYLVSSVILWKTIHLNPRSFAKAWVPNIAVTIVCWGLTMLLSYLITFDGDNYWLPILVIASLLPPVWMLSLKIFGHPLYVEIIGVLQSLLVKINLRAT